MTTYRHYVYIMSINVYTKVSINGGYPNGWTVYFLENPKIEGMNWGIHTHMHSIIYIYMYTHKYMCVFLYLGVTCQLGPILRMSYTSRTLHGHHSSLTL